MKGIIFNLVEEVVTDTYGETVWDSLLTTAGLDGSYTSLGNYPDEDLFGLVAAASAALDAPPNAVIRQLGEGALPLLADRYPAFFEGHTGTRTFLLTLNDIIHAEVRKLYPGAEVPEFEFETTGDDGLSIRYQSPRKLCALAEGFIAGAAAHYGERVGIEQPECMHHGADHCLLQCTFGPR